MPLCVEDKAKFDALCAEYERIQEIEMAAAVSDLAVERDPAFIPAKTISAYADEARKRGLIEV